MADTYESYEVYIRSDKAQEFRELIDTEFSGAIELNWRDTIDVDEDFSDESYEAYVDSDRKDEFRTALDEHFGSTVELNWRETIEA